MSGLRAGPVSLRQALEIVLVVLLAIQSARLVWAVLTPVGPLGVPAAPRPPAAPTPDLSVLERFNPFYRGVTPASVAVAAPADASQLGLRLHGVRGPMFGDRGSAIIATPDGKQGSYLVGETVTPGVTLQSVGGDHAVLLQNGASLRLELADYSAAPVAQPQAPPPPTAGSENPGGLRLPPPPASAPAAAPGPAAAIDPQRFLAEAGLRPRTQGGRINGYTLAPRGRGEMLRQAGLQPGDVILAFDGRTLENVERLEEMSADIRNNPEAEIRFERNGQVMTTRVRTGR